MVSIPSFLLLYSFSFIPFSHSFLPPYINFFTFQLFITIVSFLLTSISLHSSYSSHSFLSLHSYSVLLPHPLLSFVTSLGKFIISLFLRSSVLSVFVTLLGNYSSISFSRPPSFLRPIYPLLLIHSFLPFLHQFPSYSFINSLNKYLLQFFASLVFNYYHLVCP